MQVSNVANYNYNNKQSFKSGLFYTATAEIEKNAVLNRAIVDLGGVFPWLLSTNNKEEKKERTLNLLTFFSLAFLAPFVTVPAANRLAMKGFKMTKGLFSNNHKAIQLANEYLVNAQKTEEGIKKLAQKTEQSFLETFYRKITGKKTNNTLNLDELLKSCGNDYEVLRKKLINAKNSVLCSDLLITGYTLGSLGFLNNYLTEKRTGKKGFSAELKMADSKLIANRASNYERTKKKRAWSLILGVAGISTVIPAIVRKGLLSSETKGFNGFVKNSAKFLNYSRAGSCMSRLALLLGIIMNTGGLLLASRNKTEAKDWSIRSAITTPVFFGGDLLLGGLISKLTDKIFKTQLVKEYKAPEDSKSFYKTKFMPAFRKIFPETMTMHELNDLVEKGQIASKNKKAAGAIYWGNLAIVSALLGFTVPYVCNKMIKSDVQKDLHKKNNTEALPKCFEEFKV